MSATLNVYDLVDHAGVRQLNAVGAGVYHAELEFECLLPPKNAISFGSDNGIFSCLAKQCEGHPYSHSIPLHGPPVTIQKIQEMLAVMRREGWRGGATYSIARGKCCVTFVRRLSDLLELQGFPHYVDRGGRFASLLKLPVDTVCAS